VTTLPSAITAIIPCMGRLAHLQRSLDTVFQSGLRCVLVDYSCPDQCGTWAERNYQEYVQRAVLTVVRVTGKRIFSKSAAFNAGAHAAVESSANWLLFMDADCLLDTKPATGFAAWLSANLEPRHFYVFEPSVEKKDLYGAVAVQAGDYVQSQGYDESFLGYGMEDMDFRLRLALRWELPFGLIPVRLATPIAHSDRERTRFYHQRDPKVSNRANFEIVKRHVKAWTGHELSDLHRPDLRPLMGVVG
jgi:predicted glycosyltransferase involved in capsule biosynthesis